MSNRPQRRTFDATPGSAHELVIGLVPSGARVLELGCATGYMSEVLAKRLGCAVTGLELLPDAAAVAREHCQRVLVGDAETFDFAGALGGERFDAVLFADVLEHLRDPGAVLRRIRPLLVEGGAAVASIPNVAHASVRLALLGGEFRYAETGLLDRTHVRFFTRESIQDLFEEAGFAVTHWSRRRLGVEESEIAPPAREVPPAVRAWLAEDPEATTYQFVVRATPSENAAADLQRRVRAREKQDGERWNQRVTQAGRELAAVLPAGAPFILVDEDRLRGALGSGLEATPFPERAGQYGGPPSDDAEAIGELERLRNRGARFLVVAWPAFWWLDYYAGLARHLRTRYRAVVEGERFMVFDLRVADG